MGVCGSQSKASDNSQAASINMGAGASKKPPSAAAGGSPKGSGANVAAVPPVTPASTGAHSNGSATHGSPAAINALPTSSPPAAAAVLDPAPSSSSHGGMSLRVGSSCVQVFIVAHDIHLQQTAHIVYLQ
jgi:hypothetical protein